MIQTMPDDEFIKILNAELYMAGQRACKNGEKHEEGKGADFDRGFSDQYQMDQINDWRTKNV